MAQKVTIDGREFDVEGLSEDVRKQIVSVRLADQRIAQLQQELAFVQTARNSYARALAVSLPKEDAPAVSEGEPATEGGEG